MFDAAQEVPGANRRWRWPFRCRGSRRESAVVQLSALGCFCIMRLLTRFPRFSSSIIVFASGMLLAGGCLSSPRDYSSPPTTIKIVSGENGAPLSNVEVIREWDDSDCETKGSDTMMTDQTGTARFPKIPAKVGLFTGAWRKTHDNLGPRGAGSGTTTTIEIRLMGVYDVKPKDGALHKLNAGGLYDDNYGFLCYTFFYTNRSNMMTAVTFPDNSKLIDYVLSAKSRSQ